MPIPLLIDVWYDFHVPAARQVDQMERVLTSDSHDLEAKSVDHHNPGPTTSNLKIRVRLIKRCPGQSVKVEITAFISHGFRHSISRELIRYHQLHFQPNAFLFFSIRGVASLVNAYPPLNLHCCNADSITKGMH